jgi:hypothetical protein
VYRYLQLSSKIIKRYAALSNISQAEIPSHSKTKKADSWKRARFIKLQISLIIFS